MINEMNFGLWHESCIRSPQLPIIETYEGTTHMSNATLELDRPLIPEGMTSPKKGKVLIIDDEPGLLKIMDQALSREHEVSVLKSTGEALNRIRCGEVFDAILCDMWMPWMSGFEFMRNLEETNPTLAKKVIFVSGDKFTRLETALMSSAGSGCLAKPFSLKSMMAKVREVVGD
jgi:two-component system NtrC family sensor kinase